jgi:gamma-glutamylcyclotransferase (GGCT)/AIG2-like uncharacterized protein YtfP
MPASCTTRSSINRFLSHLFVYGTLRRGSENQFARLLAERGHFVGVARVPGRLYDLGRYPGAMPSNQPNEWIHGEVFSVDAELLAALDEYEGPEFERAIVPAIGCWIYWYIGAATGRLIASGDFSER